MAIQLLPAPKWRFFDSNGNPAVGYKVYTYQPGTSTPKATYTDYTGSTANDNPVILNARGEADIWFDGILKIIVKDKNDVTIYTQDNYGEGTNPVLQGNFNLAKNGSFETDANGDGEPDDWTVVEYTNSGGVTRDSSEQIHGQYSLKFLSTGSGGGHATSDYFEVQEDLRVPVVFSIKSSVADVHNQVDVVWYTAAKSVISTTTVYDDATTNPTSWELKAFNATPPTNARFARVRLFGCKDDDATTGSTWFDNVQVEAFTGNKGGALVYNSGNQSIGTLGFDSEAYDPDSIHDTATNNSRLTVPAGVTKVRLTGFAEITASSSAYMLLRITKNGGLGIGLPSLRIPPQSAVINFMNVASAVLEVVEGDYFEMFTSSELDNETATGGTDGTWFSMEVIE